MTRWGLMKWVAVFAGLALLSFSTPSKALCLCSCTVTAPTFPFGAFLPLNNTDLDVTGNVRVDCLGVGVLSDYSLKLGSGLHGTFSQRQMRSGVNPLNYNFYSNAGRTIIWGDGTGTYNPVTVTNLLGVVVWTSNTSVYGRIPAAPTTKPSATQYSDSVLVTVEY